jgi:ubiquinone/menaquinone biosynthesis C-methylase UbiE
MASQVGWTGRARYAAGAVARIAWYGGAGLAMRRYVRRIEAAHPQPAAAPPRPKPTGPVPDWPRLLRDIAALMRHDLEAAQAGLYPLPDDRDPDGVSGLLDRTRRFVADVPEVARRRREGAHQEVDEALRETGEASAYPRYYRQNFHFQSGGWLSDDSARIYDTQVETLFTGAAAAMRRHALRPMAEYLRRHDQRHALHIDLASGTGAVLRDVRRAFPRLRSLAVDLSEPYLIEGRRRRPGDGLTHPMVANAEALPLPDQGVDLVSLIYLFHELPPKARRSVAAEIARVLKPGGVAVLIDSLQIGDRPDYDGLLEWFPVQFHEPYFAGYVREDLPRLFSEAGLAVEANWTAFLSKVLVVRKPERTGAQAVHRRSASAKPL